MAGPATLLRPPPAYGATAELSALFSPPRPLFFRRRGWKKPGRRAAGMVARLCNGDPDSLLRAALGAASLRFQETLRPDPLFIDPYAGSLLSPAVRQQHMEETSPVSTPLSSPCHYMLATKFFDNELLSLVSRMEELRQIVLLTDGMDTRPYRLNWPRLTVVYDISPDHVFTIASQKLKGIGAKVSRNCTLIHVPLESSDLHSILCKKGFNGSRPSLWILQGLPLSTLTKLRDRFSVVSSLAMKGSIFMGELPVWLVGAETGNTAIAQEFMEKLFMSHGFRADFFDYNEIARNMHLHPPSGDYENLLFIAEQLRLSDAEMEAWRAHFERIEEEGDEEGFEEL